MRQMKVCVTYDKGIKNFPTYRSVIKRYHLVYDMFFYRFCLLIQDVATKTAFCKFLDIAWAGEIMFAFGLDSCDPPPPQRVRSRIAI